MLNKRQTRILELLTLDDQISVNDLAGKLKVSSVTIRQDLNFLEAEGLLKRIHGGAVLKDADNIDNRLGVNYDKKLRIARKAASMVNDGETILIESGSTNALLARELINRNVTIITTNIYIARQFRKEKQTSVIILGGLYQYESESLVGKITKNCIDQIHFDKAFLGIDGYTRETGFTLRDLFRAEISGYIIKKSKEVFIISDSSKFGKTGLTNICSACDIQHIVTDNELDKSYIKEFKESGIDIIPA